MLIDRKCKFCEVKFQAQQTKLTPVSTCPDCRKMIVKHNFQCVIQSWIDAFPEVELKVKYRLRKLKSGPKHYFYISGTRTEHFLPNTHYIVFKDLLPMIRKSFSRAEMTSGDLGEVDFNIVIAEY